MIIKSYDNGYATQILQTDDSAIPTYLFFVIVNDTKEVLSYHGLGTEKSFALRFFDKELETMEVKK